MPNPVSPLTPQASSPGTNKSGARFYQAVMKLCAANARLRDLRTLWRQVKRDHNGEPVCCRASSCVDAWDWCEVCDAYPMAEYKATIKARSSAMRSMMLLYPRISPAVAQPMPTNDAEPIGARTQEVDR